ncbi:hypothetical protein D3C77_597750 [compost metagenome]
MYGHGPEGDLSAVLDPGGLEQLTGLVRVVASVLDAVIVGPLSWRHAVYCQLAGVLVNRLDDGRLVHCHVHGLADLELVKGFVLDVVGDVAEVEARVFDDLQVSIVLQRLKVCRPRVDGDLALILAQFLNAY